MILNPQQLKISPNGIMDSITIFDTLDTTPLERHRETFHVDVLVVKGNFYNLREML